jgi:hypothetical protein
MRSFRFRRDPAAPHRSRAFLSPATEVMVLLAALLVGVVSSCDTDTTYVSCSSKGLTEVPAFLNINVTTV